MTRKSHKHKLQDAKIKTVERLAEESAGRVSMFALMTQDPTSTPEPIDYAWVKAARAALKIEDLKFAFFPDASGTKLVRQELPPDFVDTTARDIRLTFEKFKLDPDDPWSWRMMATYMSLLFSGAQAKKGRPKTATPERLMQLHQMRESAALKKLTDSEAAYWLANDKSSPFHKRGVDSKAGVEGLRKQIGKARRTFGTK
jgi:hypothetical protein